MMPIVERGKWIGNKGCWLFVIKIRRVKESRRLRDWPFWRRKNCKKVEDRYWHIPPPATRSITGFLHRGAGDIPMRPQPQALIPSQAHLLFTLRSRKYKGRH
jgi:hypothetical protein